MKSAVFLWATQAIVLTPVSSWDTEIIAFFTVIGRLDHTKGLPGKWILCESETAVSGKGSLLEKLIWLKGYEIIFATWIKLKNIID